MQLWKRNLLAYRRTPDLLVFSTIQPVMFVLLFSFVFGGAIQTGPIPYIDFLLPGILVQSGLFGSTQTGVGLAEDVRSGMIDRYRSLPMARSAVIAGRILADATRNMFVLTLMVGVGFIIGFRFHGSVAGAIAMVLVGVVFAQAFSWISAAIGMSVRRAETAQVASFVLVFPLTFISSVFVPIETMPDWLRAVAEHSPVTLTVDAMRGLALGTEFWESLMRSSAWIVGIMVVFIPVAIWRYRRIS
jgi:ABC-2 type transport system permease protein/oleandomycin transport system permease protein